MWDERHTACLLRFDHMQQPSTPTSRRPAVLLVQPTRDDGLDMYTEFLRDHGLAVIPVSHSREALMLAPQADIVVTGMTLDDPMNGVELVSRLRRDDGTRSTPIIVLTACAWPTDRERAGAGCDVFLLQPCLPNDLLCEVWQLLTATGPRQPTHRTSSAPSHRAAPPRGRVACRSPAVACADEVIVMARSTNRQRRSAISPAPHRSSLKSAALDRSATVTEYDIARRVPPSRDSTVSAVRRTRSSDRSGIGAFKPLELALAKIGEAQRMASQLN